MDSQNRHAADGFLQADGTGNLKWYREGDTLYIEVIGKLERNLYWLKNTSKVVILPGCTAIGKKSIPGVGASGRSCDPGRCCLHRGRSLS